MTMRISNLSRLLPLLLVIGAAQAQTNLADQPVYSSINVAGNLVLTPSVEFPTALSNANGSPTNGADFKPYGFQGAPYYPGLFDPTKCYQYNYTPPTGYAATAIYAAPVATALQGTGYFSIAANASGDQCDGTKWSGNYLNWATTGTLDVFRQVLTGGYRSPDGSTPGDGQGDTATQTIIEKAYSASPQFSNFNSFPLKISYGSNGTLSPFVPVTSGIQNFHSRVWGLGNRMYFSVAGTGTSANQYGNDNGALLKTYAPLDGGLPLAPPYPLDYDGHQIGAPITVNTAAQVAADALPTTVYAVQIRVKVCGSSSTLESNYTCTQYGSNYKPEGLIQQYANKIRFALFSYLNNANKLADAGVLRAKMDFVGPQRPSPFSAATANANAAWSGTTGAFTLNPNPQDATATAAATGATNVNDSGVVNYLNKFGEAGKSYKTYDSVSELFYAGVRYFRGQANVPEWSNLVTASTTSGVNNAQVDGFPVITNWGNSTSDPLQNQPIQYSCQKNFILGIGDDNTHTDSNVPGTLATADTSASTEPTKPVSVVSDIGAAGVNTAPSIDAATSTNQVGALEALSGDPLVTSTATGTSFANFINSTLSGKEIFGPTPISYTNGAACTAPLTCPRPTQDDSTFAIAGLAYHAHTVDQRPNDFKNTDGSKTFTQTISTYWMDVQFQGFDPYNQYWLAAKYGGFTVPSGFLPYATAAAPGTISTSAAPVTPSPALASWHTNTSTDTRGSTTYARPDNYFSGGDPVSMKNGLTAAFASIANTSNISAFTSSFSAVSLQVQSTGNLSYASNYQSGSWVGDVVAVTSTFDSSGNQTSQTQQWDAQALLDTQAATVVTGGITVNGWDTKRFIATSSSATSNAGVAFRSNTLTSTLGYSDSLIKYLRGDRSNEISNGGIYRTRTHLLGDIVDSSLVPVGNPNAPYSDSNNPGYSTFRANNAARSTVVYVGANDGFMHAFDGTTGSTGGTELFAYMPSLILSGPSTPATPTVDGAASLANNPLAHHYLVDATPVTADVDFARSGTTASPTTASNWHTILVGGLGKGGKGYYALDITSAQTTGETTGNYPATSKVLWEFTDSDMGFTYGPPIIVKTTQYGWVVIVTSGYNNTGDGYLYILNAQTGQLVPNGKIKTNSAGTSANPSGLAYAVAFVNDYTSYTTDAVYAGDLLGNLWRFDLTKTSGSYPAPALFAKLTDSSGNPQPITTTPSIQVDPSTLIRYVTVGTGRLLASTDLGSSNVQTFYAFKDGTATVIAPYVAGSTLTRASGVLTNDTSTLTAGFTDSSTSKGFYIDLPVTSGVAARVIISPIAYQNIISFATTTPNTSDPCNPGGNSQTYVVSLSNAGKTGTLIASKLINGTVNSLNYLNVAGHVYLEAGISSPSLGSNSGSPAVLSSGSGSGSGSGSCSGSSSCSDSSYQKQSGPLDNSNSRTRLNWREIPLTN